MNGSNGSVNGSMPRRPIIPTINPIYMRLDSQQQVVVEAPHDRPIMTVAAPGAGKTATLVRRVAHLVQKRGIDPRRILMTTFTVRAAGEMRERLVPMLGRNVVQQITIGTIHSACLSILRQTNGHYRLPRPATQDTPLTALEVAPRFMLRRAIEQAAGAAKRGGLGWNDIPWGWAARWITDAKTALVWPEEAGEYFSRRLAALAPDIYGKRDGDAASSILPYDGTSRLKETVQLLVACYRTYEDGCRIEHRMDFNDMLMWVGRGFQDVEEFREQWAGRYDQVLVDEAQDTNPLSMSILNTLRNERGSIFYVADPDQALYAFNGATPVQNVYGFKERHPNGALYFLETNYRSPQSIVDITNKAIAASYEGKADRADFKKTIRVVDGKGPGSPVTVSQYLTQTEEASSVVKEIKQGIETGGRKPGDYFIVYRTNATSRPFEDALIRANIPYIVHGSQSFYERQEVQEIVAFLRLVQDGSDNEAFRRVANIPSANFWGSTHGFGKVWMEDMAQRAALDRCSMLEAARRAALSGGMNRMQASGMDDFLSLLDRVRDASIIPPDPMQPDSVSTTPAPAEYDPHNAALQFIRLAYEHHLNREKEGEEADDSTQDTLSAVVQAASSFGTVADFTEYVRRVQELRQRARQSESKPDAVFLGTIHSVKGNEAPVVFGVGINDMWIPHRRSMQGAVQFETALDPKGRSVALPYETRSSLEDERCAFYVLVSRAREELHLSWTRDRAIDPRNGVPGRPSRFLIETGLIKMPGMEEGAGKDGAVQQEASPVP